MFSVTYSKCMWFKSIMCVHVCVSYDIIFFYVALKVERAQGQKSFKVRNQPTDVYCVCICVFACVFFSIFFLSPLLLSAHLPTFVSSRA